MLTPGLFQVYDDSDGTLIVDDDCLIALAEQTQSTKNCLLFVTIVKTGEDWSADSSNSSRKYLQ